MRCGLGPTPGACTEAATVVLRSGGALLVLACEQHGRGAVGAVPGALLREVGERESHGREAVTPTPVR